MVLNEKQLLELKTGHQDIMDIMPIARVIERYEQLIIPMINGDAQTHFDRTKVEALVCVLLSSLIDAQEIYVAIDKTVGEFCATRAMTIFESSHVMDLMFTKVIDGVLRNNDRGGIDQLLKITQGCDVVLLNAIIRKASGHDATMSYQAVMKWLSSDACEISDVFDFNHHDRHIELPFDQQQAHLALIHEPAEHQKYVEQLLKDAKVKYAIGLYGEDRGCYQSGIFKSPGCNDNRSIHLGLDVFTAAQQTIYAPIAGKVLNFQYNAEKLDYGYTLILSHRIPKTGTLFYTLYGHLSHRTLDVVSKSDVIEAGQIIGYLGDHHENGGWSPHLHFQIITDMLSCEGDFYGACEPSMWPLWQQICPDPQLLLNFSKP